MSNSLNPIFGEWYTDRQIGTGTDGKVFSIYREKNDGSRETSILKIIRLGENRNERKVFDLSEKAEKENSSSETKEDPEAIINNIKRNIRSVMKTDNGKNFIRYEDVELRNASDGKGRLILIRLEEAKSLAELLKEISLTLDETIRLGINICNSLIKCRSFNYIYPNLKPENILFDRAGRCKLGDFGTFCYLEPAKTSVAYKRTQYYMAPEVVRTGKFNCTVDTYSLGLILYMLSNRGRLPFAPAYPEEMTINSLNTATATRLKGLPLEKPQLANDALWKIISKACSYNINERYLTPDQMLADLKSALENKPFGEAVYEDVYSLAAEDNYAGEEKIIIPELEIAPTLVEPKAPPVSLKEEITIPDVSPVYNQVKKTVKKNKKIYEKLPEIKKKSKGITSELRKILIMSAIAVMLVVLLIVSLVLRHGDASAEVLMMLTCGRDIISDCGGASLWLLI